MAVCERCNICDNPGSFGEARDVACVPCNVRAFQSETFTFWRCEHCRSLHCREDADLDRYYRAYPVKIHALDFWTRAAYANYLNRLLDAGLRPQMSILDYGCGPGLLVRYLGERGFGNIRGYDAHVAQYSDGAALARRYDCVVTQDVIEHAENPAEFLAAMADRLLPGGLLVIGTPNAEHIELARPAIYSLSLHPPYHRHLLSEQALCAMAAKLGLKVVARYHRFYYDTLWPTVNYRFLRSYVRRAGNLLDAAFEPPKIGLVMTSPVLWLLALFGYFFPPRSEMMMVFRRTQDG